MRFFIGANMSIYGQLQQYASHGWIELFELDLTKFGDIVYRFHDGLSPLGQAIVWQGLEYTPYPVKAEGFALDGLNPVRPRITFSNLGGAITLVLAKLKGIEGARLTRKRTKIIYLDAVNFENGNLTADPNAHLPDDIFYISQKTSEDHLTVSFELLPATDLEGVKLPRRQIVAQYCTHKYKGQFCGYTGDKATCAKTLADCKAHFGEHSELPFGGFPSAAYMRI